MQNVAVKRASQNEYNKMRYNDLRHGTHLYAHDIYTKQMLRPI